MMRNDELFRFFDKRVGRIRTAKARPSRPRGAEMITNANIFGFFDKRAEPAGRALAGARQLLLPAMKFLRVIHDLHCYAASNSRPGGRLHSRGGDGRSPR